VPEESGAEVFARRYGDLVYAAAFRQVGDAHAAADVMQGVFMVMVRKEREGRLSEERFMAGWLLRVTNYVVKEMKRAGRRRVFHESRTAEVRPEEVEVSEEEKGAVLERLDEVMLAMRAVDREVIARRYLRSESVGEVAAALGMTENTASKRIARALEKLRAGLARRGMTMGVTGIAGVIAGQALVKTPAAVAGAVGAETESVTVKVVKGVIWRLVMAKAKVVAGVALAGMLLIGGTTIFVWNISKPSKGETKALVSASLLGQGATARGENAQDDLDERPAPTELSKRYSSIFTQLDEKRQMDDELNTAVRSIGRKVLPTAHQEILDMQIKDMVIAWNHIEAATKDVAQRHGESIAVLANAPPMPSDPLDAGLERVIIVIHKRMVIPLDDAMAKEVLDLANARYAMSKESTTQP
jgi:RNA polymerase sigma factor (sigma-70 family)